MYFCWKQHLHRSLSQSDSLISPAGESEKTSETRLSIKVTDGERLGIYSVFLLFFVRSAATFCGFAGQLSVVSFLTSNYTEYE